MARIDFRHPSRERRLAPCRIRALGIEFRPGAIAFLVAALCAGDAFAQSQQVPVGPRAVAMGGAFTAIADDATAIYWNPAGLASVGHQEFTGSYANLFDADIKDNFLVYVLPLSRRQAVAVDWYHSGFSDPELDFGENRFGIAYSMRFSSLLSVGLGGKYLRRGLDLDGVTVVSGSGSGFGLDLGALSEPYPGLRLGLLGQDVFDTEIESSDGSRSVAFPRNVRGAVSYTIGRHGTVALDVDDRWHLGGELRPLEPLALRAGVEDDRRGGEGATWAAGLGLELGFLSFDYAWVNHPVLASTNHFGLSVAFNFNPAEVRIEKVQMQEIYTSLYKSYAHKPLGSVVLRNLRDRPLETRLSVHVRGLMDTPTETAVILRPKASQEVPLTALLSEKCLTQRGDHPVHVAIAATYQSHLLLRTEKGTGRGIAYGPGAIDWGQGVAQAAAFVTTRDPAVESLARQVTRGVTQRDQEVFATRNIAYAAVLFEALGALGVAYVPDPNNPYATMSETSHAVDTVHYPSETLAKRAGDCDDTTVLMAALLSNVGVPTRFVDVPQHIFILVGTDLHERHRAALTLEGDLYVVADDEVWIPLETTAIGRGFAAAWREGADRYREHTTRGNLELVDVAAAQGQYPPAQPPGMAAAVADMDTANVRERLAEAAQQVGAWRQAYLAAHYASTRQNLTVTASAQSELARVYFLAGRHDESRAKLLEARESEPRSAMVLNNLAVLEAARGDLQAALARCGAALALDATDAGIWLNLGMLRYAAGDTLAAGEPLAKGMEMSGGWAQACRLLGLPAQDEEGRAGTLELSEQEARELLAAALRRLPPAPSAAPPAAAPAGAGTEKAPDLEKKAPGPAARKEPEMRQEAREPGEPKPASAPASRRVGGARAGEAPLEKYLYWKEAGGER